MIKVLRVQKKKINKTALFVLFLTLFVSSIAETSHQIFVKNISNPNKEGLLNKVSCGGVVVPDNTPMPVTEASTIGEPVVLKQASQNKIHVIDIAFIFADSITNKGKLLQNVEAAVLRANVIFQRSGVNARLRTVAVQPDRKYTISLDGINISSAIGLMVSVLPEVRVDYGADLVYALTTQRDPTACARAHLRSKGTGQIFAARYLSAGAIWNGTHNDGCFGDNFVLAHEVGHNLGLIHNVEDTRYTPFVSFGKGYKGKNIKDRSYSTVMALRGNVFNRFSTDSADHKGLKIGSSEANAAKALLYTIEETSNYSPTKVRDPKPSYTCPESDTSTCLQNGRFRVEATVSYMDSVGVRKDNQKAKVKNAMLNGVNNQTSSLFYFFNESNPELLVKVLNGCGVNGKFWVYGSASTDLDHSILVTDNATGVTIPYHRNSSEPLINDTNAFPCYPKI